MSRSFTGDFKRFFGRGLAIVLPSIVTLWILWQAFGFVFNNVGLPINRLIRLAVIETVEYFPESQRPGWYHVQPEQLVQRQAQRARDGLRLVDDRRMTEQVRREQFQEFWSRQWYLEAAGLVIAIILIYLAGLLLSNFVGRSIYLRLERLIARIPGFKQIYPHVKQVVELILGDKKLAFSKVVLVEYPSQDIWTIGFLTGEAVRSIDTHAGERVRSVFIPTSPTPFTGFTINVPVSKIRDMDMTMEEALRFVITAGVLTPGSPSPPPMDPARLSAAAAREAARAAPPPGEPGTGEKRRETA